MNMGIMEDCENKIFFIKHWEDEDGFMEHFENEDGFYRAL